MLWSDWLKQHKRRANNDCLLTLSRNHNFQNLCIGWRNTTVTLPLEQTIPDEGDVYKQAWALAQYDLAELSEKSSIHITEGLRGLVQKAAALGIIYPDGTINEAAGKLLSAIIAKEVKNAAKQPPQTTI